MARAILLVDDEAIILLALKQSLRMHFGADYRYETASSAEEGLACIEDRAAEGIETVLIISDWLMPGMKGDEFLSRVHGLHPETKLIMVSGHADDAEMARLGDTVKLEAFIRKPWSPERLFEVMEAALA